MKLENDVNIKRKETEVNQPCYAEILSNDILVSYEHLFGVREILQTVRAATGNKTICTGIAVGKSTSLSLLAKCIFNRFCSCVCFDSEIKHLKPTLVQLGQLTRVIHLLRLALIS